MRIYQLPILGICLFSLILYYPALSVFLSQDDFFHIKVSLTDGTLRDFISLFGFYPFEERGIAFYRPVFREAFFNTFYNLFSLNALAYRVAQFLLHFINIYLVYLVIQKYLSDKRISILVALFFGISSAHVATIYYLTGGIQVLGALFFVLSTLLLFDKHKLLSFVTFLLAVSSHELSVVILPLLIINIWIKERKLRKLFLESLKLWPHILSFMAYLLLNFFIIGFSKGEVQYQAVFSIKTIINTYSWYVGWAFGLPEMLIDFVRSGLSLNPSLMRYWGDYFKVIFPAFFASVGIFAIFVSAIFLKQKKFLLDKKLTFFLTWFALGVLPVSLLPWHKSTYYLYIALVGFWGSTFYIAIKFLDLYKKYFITRIVLTLFILFLGALNITSIFLGGKTYWAASRGRAAERLLQDIKATYPTLPKGSVLYIKNDPNYPFVSDEWGGTAKQARLILNNQDAVQLFYNDFSLKVIYEDLETVDENKNSLTLPIVAKLNQ